MGISCQCPTFLVGQLFLSANHLPMKINVKRSTKFFLFNICIAILTVSCHHGKGDTANQNDRKPTQTEIHKIKKATFYLENSESMFGYVSSITDYVDVVAELAAQPELVKESTPLDFYFINGDKPTLTSIGKDPLILKNKLNVQGFNCGDITKSNLNAMFQVALQNAKDSNVSILISDGIYDIGGQGIQTLVTSGKDTRSQFIKRLMTGDLQTIMIKLNSKFSGKYFYASKRGEVRINSTRPYYIWIFGESKLLNKYYTNQYISTQLKGYETMARFMKPGTGSIQYQATSEHSVGTFKFDKRAVNSLEDAQKDRHGLGFQFSIAVDYSALPFSEAYLTSPANYTINNNYSIVSIKKITKRIFAVPFPATHLITVQTKNSPLGTLSVSIKNNVPPWIATTDSNTEANIQTDTKHTFGLRYLTKGIIEAYESMSNDQNIANLKIEIR